MRHLRQLPSLLALCALALSGCGDTLTDPIPESTPGAPRFAVTSNSWITRANMPVNRFEPAAATVTNAAGQSVVYAIGGRTAAGDALATVTAYNVATNSWTSRRSLPGPRYSTNGAGVIDGKIYVSGGCYDSDCSYNPPSGRLYMYDPARNTWTEKRPMPGYGGGDGGLTGVMRGKLYVLTKCYEDQGGPWNPECQPYRFYRYNPATDRWATLAPPPIGIGESGMGGVIGGKLYVMGSLGPNGLFAVYDPNTNAWTLKTPLARPRFGSATAVLAGKLYVMGGIRINSDGTRDRLDVTIAYDPATNAWTRRASLPTPRYGIAGSTVFLDGKPRIEVVGGIAPGNNLQYIP